MGRIAFVTGGTGFIGSHLVERLLHEGWDEVRCLVRREPKWLHGLPVTFVSGSLEDLARFALEPSASATANERGYRIARHLSGVTHVFHFAAMTRARSEAAFRQANVHAPVGLLNAALNYADKLERIVVASSLAVIGTGSRGVAREEDPHKPVSGYGRSKAAMEAAIGTASDSGSPAAKLPITIIRPPAVYGPRERDIYTYIQAAARRLCPYPIDRKRVLSLAYVDDVVSGTVLAGEHTAESGRSYFLGSPHPVGWKDFVAALRTVMSGPLLELPVPRPVFRATAAVVEDVTRRLGIFPPFHREKAQEMLEACAACSSERATRELGYRPNVNLVEGLRRSVDWYREQRWI